MPESFQSLTESERRVLAVLAVVGEASLTADEAAELAEVDEVRPVLDELRRRGLVRQEDDRDALAPGLGAKLRRAWDLTDTTDRVLRQVYSIAQDGRLTLDDLPAILGVSRWAAEAGRWSELLSLIRLTETALDVKQRVEVWIQIVEQARTAARKLGDIEAEAWAENQLADAGRAIANASAAAAGAATTRIAPDGSASTERDRTRTWLKLGAATLLVGGAGFGVGYVASGDASSTGSTVTIPGTSVTLPARTITLPGATTTLAGATVTVPAETVTLPAETSTVVSTETTTTTTTVVSTVVTTVSAAAPG